MKKVLLFLALCAGPALYAQQFGMSAHALMSFQLQRDIEVPYQDRTMRSGTAPAFGVRLETNYILPGRSIPVAGYSGIGITYIAPATDSVIYEANFRSGGSMMIVGTEKISMMSIALRFGYEFPQEFDEFLMINYGFGMGWSNFKRVYQLPEQSSTFNYTSDDFEEERFLPTRDGGVMLEIWLGGVYEFERFSVIGQYSGMIPFGGYDSNSIARIRHGLSAGIFYTLADLR